MGKRHRYYDAIDPDLRRWGQRYPKYPGVDECVRLIRAGKARGSWAEIIVGEMADHAEETLPELIAAFRNDDQGDVALYVMMALEIAATPSSIEFLADRLRGEATTDADRQYAECARRALRAIDTRESRTALFQSRRGESEDGSAK